MADSDPKGPRPAISVIIPAYRQRDFVHLRKSFAANSDVDAEWIVVDDGSGSAFDKIFAELPSEIRVLREPQNRGQSVARNVGLDAARGKWIKFLDADDQLDEGHLAALFHAATRRSDDRSIPYARTRHVFPGGASNINDSARDLAADPNAQLIRQLVRPFVSHCGALFPHELLVRLSGYDELLVTDEDGDLLIRILQSGHYFVPVDGVHYLYRHHSHQKRVSADDNLEKLRARILTCDKVEASFPSGMPADVAHAVAQRLDKIAMAYWSSYPSEARQLLVRARSVSPGYRSDGQLPVRALRALGGPRAVAAATRLYRRLRGRPTGGAQG